MANWIYLHSLSFIEHLINMYLQLWAETDVLPQIFILIPPHLAVLISYLFFKAHRHASHNMYWRGNYRGDKKKPCSIQLFMLGLQQKISA